MSSEPILVIGGGWAGLATAVEIARAGFPVKVFESAPQIGGRARTVALDGFGTVDNGQHLLLGANDTILAMLGTLGVNEADVLLRLPLDLVLRRPEGPNVALSALYLPAPFHLLAGLMTMEGIPLSDRFNALLALKGMLRGPDDRDMPVSAWLRVHEMPLSVTEALWKPLCLAILNLGTQRASAELFCAVLRESFTGHRSRSDFLVPRRPLSEVFPEPARRFIEQNGGEVHTACRVTELVLERDVCTGVIANETFIAGRQVVLAVSPWAAAPLLAPHPKTAGIAARLERLGSEPIVTVWLRYPPGIRLERPVSGLLDTTAQWLFDHKAISGHEGVLSVVISGSGPHLELDHDALAAQVAAELGRLYPEWPAPETARVLRERRATFHAAPGCEALRPGNETDLIGLWLAGDYTRTGLPATLEGAIRSGVCCARMLLDS